MGESIVPLLGGGRGGGVSTDKCSCAVSHLGRRDRRSAAVLLRSATVRCAAMSREELPPDFSDALDYDGLLEVLGILEGKEVSVVFGGGPDSLGAQVELVGELHRRPAADPVTAWFRVGSNPGLRLPRGEFVSARLGTLEGTFYFNVAIEMRGMAFVVGSPDLIGDQEP
jgi:hypothetical protein